MVEVRRVRATSDAVCHAPDRRIFAAGSVSPGRESREYASGDCIDSMYCAVSGFLRAEFAGPGGSRSGGSYVLGVDCLPGRASAVDGDLVLSGSASQGDCDSRASGFGMLGAAAIRCTPAGMDPRVMDRLFRERGVARKRFLPLLVPVAPLVLWYFYHWAHTGYVFGNPEFFRYNVAATLNPVRFLLALVLRLWQAFGYMHLWLLTLGMLLAMLLPPVKDGGIERSRIAIPVQMIFLVVVKVYVVAMALIGGAELARYMLPAVPLVIIVGVSTLRRRLRDWSMAVAVVAVAFVVAWFWNPPYGFSPEDNLAYRDYIVLHQDAERFLEARYPMAHVMTAWPASDELARPWLGYTTRPMQVVQIENFSLEQVVSAAEFRSHFEVALVFSTKYEPPHPLLERWKTWEGLKRRFFDFHRDLPPAAAAQILGGRVVYSQERKGQWVAVIEMERSEIENAKNARLD